MRQSGDAKNKIIKKKQLLRRKQNIVARATKTPRKASQKKVLIPSSFTISESYIRSQIDGLIVRKTNLKKRKVRHLTVTSEQEHPITETVQAILAEPEAAPIPTSLPIIEEPQQTVPEQSIEITETPHQEEQTPEFQNALAPQQSSEPIAVSSEFQAELEPVQETSTAVAVLQQPSFELASVKLEEPTVHIPIREPEPEVPETIPVHIVPTSEPQQTPEKVPATKNFFVRCLTFVLKIFTEFAKPDPRRQFEA